ncbi:zona pellucida sperm-binding protein 2-like isoform X2 [Rhinatrema bivittatum]|uniref:zona pellucida sperm-binding protein 2-like isoform X2 n=2 Tax=Rhinatrema bivittatum TaxID=194408 RepID=UPI00112BD36C|nr:zona pellucida sperm-binding protein 2-like isoform X2 [Rhinatrema bivittatum]
MGMESTRSFRRAGPRSMDTHDSCRYTAYQLQIPDQYGRVLEINEALAVQCGYTISTDFRGNIEFRASLISCYSQIVDDKNFTITVQIDVSTTPDMREVSSYVRALSCSYFPWSPREILCETNYMEVSVRREIPGIKDYIQDQPDDWTDVLPEAASVAASIWQVVFHLPSAKRAMLVSEAQNAGYGINTTDSRILLRAPFNASEARETNISGVTFSVVRSSTFYKQRWMILLVDTAVACPVDGIEYINNTIIWSIPKSITPLQAGARYFNDSRVVMGVNFQELTSTDISKRQYNLSDDGKVIAVQIPIGDEGGYFKSHVTKGEYGTTYSINVFFEHQWNDNRWGATKHTIIKEMTTPFKHHPLIITNNTIPSKKLFNVTIGTFLQDTKLVNLTIGSEILTVTDANEQGYNISEMKHPNGSTSYTVTVPFDDPNVKKKHDTGVNRTYTLSITYKFQVIPQNQTFTATAIISCPLPDAVLPDAIGYCDNDHLYLTVTRGNIDEDWIPYISNIQLTMPSQSSGYTLQDNGTSFRVKVPRFSSLVSYESLRSSDLMITLPLDMKDSDGLTKRSFSISCSYSSQDLIACLPNGTVVVTAVKLAGMPDMDPSQFVLRDKNCRPTAATEERATFIFNVDTCGTIRKFDQMAMIYENDVLYFRPGMANPAYQLKCSCWYTINETIVFQYGFENNSAPTIQPGFGPLALVMRVCKDWTYSDFYENTEYPIARYLKDPLYLEVELLYSEDPEIELFLENCWSTASSDPSSSPQWDVVINSCENTKDTHETIFHPVTDNLRIKFSNHVKRFEVKMFTFMHDTNALLGQVYFHCSVVICDSRDRTSDKHCARKCIPDKQRFGRSAEFHYLHGHVSSGAILLVADKTVQDERVTKYKAD